MLSPEVQQERLMLGAAEISALEGFDAVTVSRVIRKAGVSRKTFYEHFENVEACLTEVVRTAFGRVREILAAVCAVHAQPASRLRAATWEVVCPER